MLLFKFHFDVVYHMYSRGSRIPNARFDYKKTKTENRTNENENRACAVHSNINGHLIKLPFKSEQKCLVYISYVRISGSRFVSVWPK